MSFSQPSSPDPISTAGQQQSFNNQAARSTNQFNSYNQSTPYGSLSYAQDQNSPSGYSVNVALSPAQQQLLNTQQGTQQTLGNTGNALASNVAGMYSSAPNIDGSAVTKQLNNWQQQYLQPIFNQQQSNTDAQLRNQGLAPGSEAYNNAENLLARNQGDVTNQYLQQNQAQGYAQALQNYQLPLQTIQQLMGGSAPQGPSFQSTPSTTDQPANYAGLAQQNFTNQQGQFQSTMGDLGQLAGAATGLSGGWGGGGGMFSSSTGGGGNGLAGAVGYAQAGSNPFLSNGQRNPYYG